jgi:hypothetical protein
LDIYGPITFGGDFCKRRKCEVFDAEKEQSRRIVMSKNTPFRLVCPLRRNNKRRRDMQPKMQMQVALVGRW